MPKTDWWGIATTEAKARAAKNGCHMLKWYGDKFVGAWRYRTPEFAQKAMEQEMVRSAEFRDQYIKDGQTPPERPWRWEVV